MFRAIELRKLRLGNLPLEKADLGLGRRRERQPPSGGRGDAVTGDRFAVKFPLRLGGAKAHAATNLGRSLVEHLSRGTCHEVRQQRQEVFGF